MMTVRALLAALILAVAGTAVTGMVAPREGAAQEGEVRPDTADLVFEREVFVYPRFARRNPFAALVNQEDTGPRYEELELLGVLYSEDPAQSVALFVGAGTIPGTDEPITYRLRRGETVGNVQVVEIQPTRVIVRVDEFGVLEERTFEVQRPSGGNNP